MFKPFDQDLDLVSMQPSVKASGMREKSDLLSSLPVWSGRSYSLGLCDIHVDAYLYMEKACGANLLACNGVKTKGAPLSTSSTNTEIEPIKREVALCCKNKGRTFSLLPPTRDICGKLRLTVGL